MHRLAVLFVTIAIVPLFGNSIMIYVEAPHLIASSVANVTTETFDELAAGKYSSKVVTLIGTYNGTTADPFEIVNPDSYGGAGGTGRYFAIGAQSGAAGPVLLTLTKDANYFGFWWSAGDNNNRITLLENGVQLASFSTADLVKLLPNQAGHTVTAINGTTYKTTDYYGNPSQNYSDNTEPFAYIDVIGKGLVFNQIQFSNSGTTSTGFESDNHSIAYGVMAPPTGDVFVEEVLSPEPACFACVALGIASLSLARKLRHG